LDDDSFRKILSRLGRSWSGYRKVRKGVKRRLVRHMSESGFRKVDDYLRALDKDQNLRLCVEQLMTVTISRFFRDRELWRVVENHLLPMVANQCRDPIRIWSAGCSGGEEAYSFAILWDRFMGKQEQTLALKLLATDLNPAALEVAKKGVYSSSSLKEISQDLRDLYFKPLAEPGRFKISDSLKADLIFGLHNLSTDEPPEKDFQIIFLRNNLLTYYEGAAMESAFRKVVESLIPGGFLVVGSHEKIPSSVDDLSPWDFSRLVFRKNPRSEP
jgi:chemotaxis protein methyltransferase CheR